MVLLPVRPMANKLSAEIVWKAINERRKNGKAGGLTLGFGKCRQKRA